MKQLLAAIAISSLSSLAFGQTSLADLMLVDIDGNKVNSREALEHNGPTLLIIWTVTCHNMIDGLDDINDDHLDDWIDIHELSVVAISVDDTRNQHKVKPFVNTHGWDFEILKDPNQDLMRAMNINVHPHIFLLNDRLEVVWQMSSYQEGDIEVIGLELEKLKE